MKIAIVNSILSQGGASKASFRLHQELLKQRVDSYYITNFKDFDDKTVLATKSKLVKKLNSLRYFIDQLPLIFYPQKKEIFSPALFPANTYRRINQIGADVVHLHWINNGFLRIEDIGKINKPVIWSFHDSWAFTGGCHLPYECTKYQDSCGECPSLGSHAKNDLSSWILSRKKRSWKNFVIIVSSQWLKNCVRSSSVFKDFRVEVIPNVLDTQRWNPTDRNLGREKFLLPKSKKLILFLGNNIFEDRNKGFHLLEEAIRLLGENDRDKICLVIVGTPQPKDCRTMPCETVFLGKVKEEELVSIYSTVDVTAVPSLQENSPYVVLESMACQTPVIAFNIGGIPDMIVHEKNGYLVPPYQENEFAKGIAWLLDNEERRLALGEHARKTVETGFNVNAVVRKHLDLYEDVTRRSKDACGSQNN